jgi:hypothetical protein
LLDVCDQLGIRIICQPKYSPEFNACELVFAFLKNRLRNGRKNIPFEVQLAELLREISQIAMINYYKRAFAGLIP